MASNKDTIYDTFVPVRPLQNNVSPPCYNDAKGSTWFLNSLRSECYLLIGIEKFFKRGVAKLDSTLVIKKATVFIQSDLVEDNYEFIIDSQGSYIDWVNQWKKSEKSSGSVHILKWELDGSFDSNQKSVSISDSSERIGQPSILPNNLTVLSNYEPRFILEASSNASYSSYYFSLECFYNAGAPV